MERKERKSNRALDLIDCPFRGSVLLATLGGGQVEGLGLAL